MKSLVGEGRGQSYVDDGDIRYVFEQRGKQLGAALDCSDNIHAVLAESAYEAVSQEEEVFGDDNAHGTSMVMVVGPPRWAVDAEATVERGQTFLNAAKSRAPGRIGPAGSVIVDQMIPDRSLGGQC